MNLWWFITNVLLLSLATEAVTEIITTSELFEPLRAKWKRWAYNTESPPSDTYIQQLKIWFDKLISCGYCTSVWVAAFFAFWSPKPNLGFLPIAWLCMVFVLHRLANWIHVVYTLVMRGRVRTYDLLIKMPGDTEDGSNGESQTTFGDEA